MWKKDLSFTSVLFDTKSLISQKADETKVSEI